MLRRFAGKIYYFVMISCGVLIAALIGIYLVSYQPFHSDVIEFYKSAQPEHHQLDQAFVDTALLSDKKIQFYRRVAEGLLRKFHLGEQKSRLQLKTLAWTGALIWHFNDRQIFTMWCEFAFAEGEMGLNKISLKKYRKTAPNLNQQQFAEIVGAVM